MDGFGYAQAERLRNSLPFLADATNDHPLYRAYYKYYELPKNAKHVLSSLRVDGYTVAVQRFEPAQPAAGTVFFVHGYLVHSGLYRKLIEFLLSLDMSVVSFDLPGHGLSSGQRGAIGAFSDYATILNAVIERFSDAPTPRIIMGHSTGGACIIEWLRDPQHKADLVVLAAPLIRSNWWWFTKFGTVMMGRQNYIFPRFYPKTTSDMEHLNWVRTQDPLVVRQFPFAWARALVLWESSLSDYPHPTLPLLVLQGSHDDVLAERHNLRFLQQHFDQARISIIPEARHDLFVESDRILKKIFAEIEAFIPTVLSPCRRPRVAPADSHGWPPRSRAGRGIRRAGPG